MKARAIATLAAIALALASGAAWAGGASKPSDNAKRDAQALFAEGNTAFGEGEYLAALEKFRGAYALFASPKILLNEATTLRLLGRNIEAAEIYERYLDEASKDPGKVDEVKRAVREIDAFLAHVELKPSEAGARIAVDGRGVEANKSFRIDPGEHAIIAEHPGFAQFAANVRLAPGESRSIEMKLRRPNERVVTDEDPGATQRVAGYITGGLGAASLVASIVFVVAESSKAKAAAAGCQPSGHFIGAQDCSPEGSSAYDEAGRLRTAANWTSIGGAIALAGGATLVFLAPKKKDASPARIGARFGVGDVTLFGRW